MTVCLLLAAGSSSRMSGQGQHRRSDRDINSNPGLTSGTDQEVPKMLLAFNGKSLLQHTIDEIQQLPTSKLLVVTGCYHSLLKEILQPQDISFTENENWEEGMGSSIRKGIQYITKHYPDANSIIILVCDQPYISFALLEEMITTKQRSGKGIVACTYDNTIGTPVLFDKKYFELLARLEGQYGAKKIVQQFAADMATLHFPDGSVDIDTPADYTTLISKNI